MKTATIPAKYLSHYMPGTNQFMSNCTIAERPIKVPMAIVKFLNRKSRLSSDEVLFAVVSGTECICIDFNAPKLISDRPLNNNETARLLVFSVNLAYLPVSITRLQHPYRINRVMMYICGL